ncbi:MULTISPECIES: sn-glycerol-3-phosphate ABC transporter ATP-binding protein UgpC [unclassified Caballeronia]|uniref:ABC transporter ATP-binding protein n=1 Tax=unclassified Caballeronia TaxID=2646786 RepID=UPI00285F5EE3|nr:MULTISPECIES: sn-glycerol-3-phosphate ABC transporter ATP-binding protein UgpC [unclassified Caballeronia]MDR5736525.1 sn-glycerol-3-phosphate ABC transporter ATP-binding protein UgpC [Caballeronia sp. LZ016]MDR5810996.1 sn-glycerol-3-phosphate ABC transporter ATP-binding protein UgpC [Caballeronia sp. LZ019]
MASLTLRNINKRYEDTEVMKSVNLDIDDGEFVVFVGPSGCGKSTLMRMIAGLEEISGGELMIDGTRVNDLPPAKRGIAMVFQSYALYPHMTLYDNMAFGLKLAGEKKPAIDAAVKQAAKILHIDHLLDRKPKQLSGGQRQRVAIGRAITRKPKVFLFDEPLSNLDAALRVKMRLEFARLHDDLKTTMIYVTHDQVEAMTLADKIVVLSAGNVEQVGTPNMLYHAPANKFVAGFIGSPKMNFLSGTVVQVRDGGVLVKYATGEAQLVGVLPGNAKPGDAVTVGIRPEHLQPVAASGEYGVSASTMTVETLGDAAYLYAETQVAPDGLISRIPPLEKHARGEKLKLGAEPDHCHMFDAEGQAFQRNAVEAYLKDHPEVRPMRASA